MQNAIANPKMTDVSCPICTHQGIAKKWGDEYSGHSIVQCQQCWLRYVSPRKTDILQQYDNDYFIYDRNNCWNIERASFYFQNHFLSLKTISKHKKFSKNALDIGCGTATFLSLGMLTGFIKNATAVDITSANKELVESRNIKFIEHDFAKASNPIEGKFDLISAHHVLEHVENPQLFLNQIRQHMTSDAVLHITIPNEGSLVSNLKSFASQLKIFPKPFKHLSPGHHLYFYTSNTLKKLLEKHGFEVLSIQTRSSIKRRNVISQILHKAIDQIGYGSWLEIVAKLR